MIDQQISQRGLTTLEAADVWLKSNPSPNDLLMLLADAMAEGHNTATKQQWPIRLLVRLKRAVVSRHLSRKRQ